MSHSDIDSLQKYLKCRGLLLKHVKILCRQRLRGLPNLCFLDDSRVFSSLITWSVPKYLSPLKVELKSKIMQQ